MVFSSFIFPLFCSFLFFFPASVSKLVSIKSVLCKNPSLFLLQLAFILFHMDVVYIVGKMLAHILLCYMLVGKDLFYCSVISLFSLEHLIRVQHRLSDVIMHIIIILLRTRFDSAR